MSHSEIAERNLAKGRYEFTEGFEVAAVNETGKPFDTHVLTIADHMTMMHLTNAGSYDQTLIHLVLSGADVCFLETGMLEADSQTSAKPSKNTAKVSFGLAPGPFSAFGLHNNTVTYSIPNGLPVEFGRFAANRELFQADIASWPLASVDGSTLRGLDFTDSLLRTAGARSRLELPPELQSSRAPALTAAAKAAEADKEERLGAFLRQHYLGDQFAQNADHVSVLAAVSIPHIDMEELTVLGASA